MVLVEIGLDMCQMLIISCFRTEMVLLQREVARVREDLACAEEAKKKLEDELESMKNQQVELETVELRMIADLEKKAARIVEVGNCILLGCWQTIKNPHFVISQQADGRK